MKPMRMLGGLVLAGALGCGSNGSGSSEASSLGTLSGESSASASGEGSTAGTSSAQTSADGEGSGATVDGSASGASEGPPGNFCECWKGSVGEGPNVCLLAPQGCSTAADCCPAMIPAGYTCLEDYPYLYECVDGGCIVGSCDSDERCAAYATQTMATGYECVASEFPCDDYASCLVTFPGTSCQTADDCCAAAPPYVCGVDFPYLLDCVGGTCTGLLACTDDAQCDTWASQNGLVNLGCSAEPEPECYDAADAPRWNPTPACQFAQPCQVAADCCPEALPMGYTCLEDYPYMYTCEGGQCQQAWCENDDDCAAYGAANGVTATCASAGG